MKRQYQLKVLGQDIAVASDSGDEHVQRVVQYVNDKAGEIHGGDGCAHGLTIAILTALNIADEYIRYKNDRTEICSQLESESKRLIDLIDETR